MQNINLTAKLKLVSATDNGGSYASRVVGTLSDGKTTLDISINGPTKFPLDLDEEQNVTITGTDVAS